MVDFLYVRTGLRSIRERESYGPVYLNAILCLTFICGLNLLLRITNAGKLLLDLFLEFLSALGDNDNDAKTNSPSTIFSITIGVIICMFLLMVVTMHKASIVKTADRLILGEINYRTEHNDFEKYKETQKDDMNKISYSSDEISSEITHDYTESRNSLVEKSEPRHLEKNTYTVSDDNLPAWIPPAIIITANVDIKDAEAFPENPNRKRDDLLEETPHGLQDQDSAHKASNQEEDANCETIGIHFNTIGCFDERRSIEQSTEVKINSDNENNRQDIDKLADKSKSKRDEQINKDGSGVGHYEVCANSTTMLIVAGESSVNLASGPLLSEQTSSPHMVETSVQTIEEQLIPKAVTQSHLKSSATMTDTAKMVDIGVNTELRRYRTYMNSATSTSGPFMKKLRRAQHLLHDVRAKTARERKTKALEWRSLLERYQQKLHELNKNFVRKDHLIGYTVTTRKLSEDDLRVMSVTVRSSQGKLENQLKMNRKLEKEIEAKLSTTSPFDHENCPWES